MKKLFVSCPMNGRTKEQILKSMKIGRAIAESYFNEEELLVINTLVDENPSEYIKNERLWHLAKSLELLAETDCCITVDIYGYGDKFLNRFKSCGIEENIIEEMHIPNYKVDLRAIAPDLFNDGVEEKKRRYLGSLIKRGEE